MPTPDTTSTTPTEISVPLSPHKSQIKSQSLPEYVRIKNRRKRYLEGHPEYFGSSLESADPLLYDHLIRTHQTAAERTSERAAKGFAGTLEADLLRSEAKLDQVKAQGLARSSYSFTDDKDDPHSQANGSPHQNGSDVTRNGIVNGSNAMSAPTSTSAPAPLLTPLPTLPNDFTSLTRDEAHQHWIETMTARFVHGEDQDFEYDAVDKDEGLDDMREEERDREEEWFNGEDEKFVGGSGSEGDDRDGAVEGKGRELKGETGVQDF